MALTLTITAARQTYFSVTPNGTGWTLSVGYCLCRSIDKAGTLQDVLVGRQEQMLHTALATGKAMPTPQETAALIRQDCVTLFGSSPGQVWIGGQQL